MRFFVFAIVWLFTSAGCSSKIDLEKEALEEIKQNDYLGAIIRLNTLLETEPDRDDIYVLRANCYLRIWKDSLSRLDLLKALELNPGNDSAKLSIGRLEFNSGNDSAAAYWYNQVKASVNLRLSAEGYTELGRLNYFNKRFSQAIACFDSAITRDSGYAMAWYYRGLSRSRFFDPSGRTDTISYPFLDFQSALHDFDKSLQCDSSLADAHFQIATVHFNMFNDSLGMPRLNKAIAMEPAYIYYLTARAHQHIRMKRFDEALDDINEAININSNEPEVWFERAYYHSETGRIRSAKADSAQAIKLKNKRRSD
jgi:tetratricopeptide (TPR) repeat protein